MLVNKTIRNTYFKWSKDDNLISGVKPRDHYDGCTFENCDFHPNVYDRVIFDNCTFVGCNVDIDSVITTAFLVEEN